MEDKDAVSGSQKKKLGLFKEVLLTKWLTVRILVGYKETTKRCYRNSASSNPMDYTPKTDQGNITGSEPGVGWVRGSEACKLNDTLFPSLVIHWDSPLAEFLGSQRAWAPIKVIHTCQPLGTESRIEIASEQRKITDTDSNRQINRWVEMSLQPESRNF